MTNPATDLVTQLARLQPILDRYKHGILNLIDGK